MSHACKHTHAPPLPALQVAAEQPKAAGSSLLAALTHRLAADALEVAGLAEVGQALVLPLATGMALTTALLALRGMRPPTARCVRRRLATWPGRTGGRWTACKARLARRTTSVPAGG